MSGEQTEGEKVMNVFVDLEVASEARDLPSREEIESWASAAMVYRPAGMAPGEAEVSVKIIDRAESAELNHTWRGRSGPTNILSFPAGFPEVLPVPLLGDLALCAPVIVAEAAEQNKPLKAHWAHMVVHGMLHLLGYDHIAESEATEMESLETGIMDVLGYPDPYYTNMIAPEVTRTRP